MAAQDVRRKVCLFRNRFGLFLLVLLADAENDHQQDERHDETHVGYSTTFPTGIVHARL